MDAVLGKSGFSACVRTYTRVLRKEESQDCVVPDTLPDIAELVTTWGSLFIRSKDVGEGRVRVEANVPAKVSFLPEGGGALCSLDVNIPFYFSAEDAAVHEGAFCMTQLKLRSLETRMLNPRKITVRAEAELTLDCYGQEETAFAAAGADCDRSIHLRETHLCLTAVSGVTEKTFVLTDEFSLPDDKPSAALLLGYQTQLCVEDIKTAVNKCVLRGSVHHTVLYQTSEGVTAVVEFSTEFSQILDTDTSGDDVWTAAQLLLSGAYYEAPASYNGRLLRTELHAVVQVTVQSERTVSCLTDAYSNLYALSLQRESRAMQRIVRAETVSGPLRLELQTPNNVEEVLSCSCECVSAVQEQTGVLLTLLLQMLYRREDGSLSGTLQQASAIVPMESESGAIQLHAVTLRDLNAAPTSSGVEVRCSAELGVFFTKAWEQDCIRAISYDEEAPLDLSEKPSLVIQRGRSSDDLWQLARENCSTPEMISKVNGLADEGGDWEKLLLIPRCI